MMNLNLSDIALNADGDLYLDGAGNIVFKDGTDAAQQHMQLALIVEQGSYLFDPSFGSHLHTLIGMPKLTSEQKEQLAKLYIINSLMTLPFVQSVDEIRVSYELGDPQRMMINIIVTVSTGENAAVAVSVG
jgi:hypothetical protein